MVLSGGDRPMALSYLALCLFPSGEGNDPLKWQTALCDWERVTVFKMPLVSGVL